MQTFLICGGPKLTEKEALSRAVEISSKFDIQTFSTQEEKGIALIRQITKTAFLRPFAGEAKSVIVLEAERLTPEAQNAFLKILEEPPTTTYFFLTATSANNLLPTLTSRCQIVNLQKEVASDTTSIGLQAPFSKILESFEKTGLDQHIEQAQVRMRLNLKEADKQALKKTHQLLATFLRLKKAEQNNVNRKLIALIAALETAKSR